MGFGRLDRIAPFYVPMKLLVVGFGRRGKNAACAVAAWIFRINTPP